MPLARILTFDPGDAADFGRHLQQLGFQVEIANPNEQRVVPADLEIEFAVCDQQQVLGRAAAIATQLETEVVVFPGAIPPLPRPIMASPQAAAYPADSPLHQHLEAARIPVEPPEANADHPQERPLNAAQIPAFSPQSDPDSSRVEREAERQRGLVFSDRMAGLGKTLHHGWSLLAGVLAVVMAAIVSGGKSFVQQARAFQRQLESVQAGIRATWQRHLAEMKQRRAEVAQHSAAQDQRKQAESAASSRPREGDATVALMAIPAEPQQELEAVRTEKQRLLAELEQLRAEVKEQSAAVERARQSVEQAAPLAEPRRMKFGGLARGRLRGAFAGAATAGLLLFVGMLLANFHSVIPLSHRLTGGSVKEQVPFGAATVQGAPGVTVGGTTVGSGVPGAKPVQATSSSPKPASQAATQPKALAAHNPNPGRHRFRRRASSDQENSTADDVVVRHFGPARKTTQTLQQARLRRYSDE